MFWNSVLPCRLDVVCNNLAYHNVYTKVVCLRKLHNKNSVWDVSFNISVGYTTAIYCLIDIAALSYVSLKDLWSCNTPGENPTILDSGF